jgi:hypothetical protein
MIALKYEMQRIKQQSQVDRMAQELEKIKKEDERAKWVQLQYNGIRYRRNDRHRHDPHQHNRWVQEQEQQLLEAKFRKQLAKENPITSTSSDPRTSAVFKPNGIKYVKNFSCMETCNILRRYDSDEGFTIFFDFIAKV